MKFRELDPFIKKTIKSELDFINKSDLLNKNEKKAINAYFKRPHPHIDDFDTIWAIEKVIDPKKADIRAELIRDIVKSWQERVRSLAQEFMKSRRVYHDGSKTRKKRGRSGRR